MLLIEGELIEKLVEKYNSCLNGYNSLEPVGWIDIADIRFDNVPWSVCGFLDEYRWTPNLYFASYDTLAGIVDLIETSYGTALQKFSGEDLVNVYYSTDKLLLPDTDLDDRRLKGYYHKGDNNVDIVDTMTGEIIQPFVNMVEYDGGFTQFSNLDSSFYICCDCGELTNEDYYGDFRRVCESCFQSGEWSVCEACGDVVYMDDSVQVHTSYGSETWCRNCADDNAYYCDDCGEYSTNPTTEVAGCNYVCDDCLEHYIVCEECDGYVHESDIYYDDDSERYLCRDCYRSEHGHLPGEFPRVISSYHTHHHNNNQHFGIGNKKIGIETEVEGAGKTAKELNEMAKALIEMSKDDRGTHIYCESDGSLNNGFEWITNPHTLDEYFKLPIKEMLQKLIDSGYTSHNNGRCGLHIHFSNEWFGDTFDEIDDNVSKVIHFYSDNYETMFKLSRRTESNACWARRFPVDDFDDAKCMKGGSVGHSTAVNLQNMNTIHTVEFRLGRGTLNYDSYMAWIDMHIAIVKNSRIIEKGDTDLNKWLAGINENTREYIKARTGIEIADAEREVA